MGSQARSWRLIQLQLDAGSTSSLARGLSRLAPSSTTGKEHTLSGFQVMALMSAISMLRSYMKAGWELVPEHLATKRAEEWMAAEGTPWMWADWEPSIGPQRAQAVRATSSIMARSWGEGMNPLTWHSWTHNGNSACFGPANTKRQWGKLKQARCKLDMRRNFTSFPHKEGSAVDQVTQR